MKQLSTIKKYLSYGLLFVIVLSVILLVISIIKSAYYYQYDNDEFYHIQRAYLITSGFRPYTSFVFIFTDIYHKMLGPILLFFGYSFATLGKVRIFMILLFAVRVCLTALLISKVFNRRAALLFIPLFLFDPFTIFSSMQIRPDNLMMTVYTLGLLIFVTSLIKPSKLLLFFSGVVFGFSFLILLKIVPQLMVLFIIYGIYCVLNRQLKNYILLLDGFILILIIFFLYHLFNGSFLMMFRQVFIFPLFLSGTIINQIYYGFFHQPNNGFIYGLMGKPLTWAYVWILPLLASAGAYLTLSNFANDKRAKSENINKKKQLIQIILIISLVVQYIFLLNLDMAFIQYYIPFQWLLALFSAVMLDDFIFKKFPSSIFYKLIMGGFFILFLILINVSINANNARSEFQQEYQITQTARIWSKIPQNSAVFPNILFRPIVYPLSIGEDQLDYNKSFSSLRNIHPSIIESFENAKLPYLIIDDSTRFYTLESGMEKYVKDHYQEIDNQINLYQRVK